MSTPKQPQPNKIIRNTALGELWDLIELIASHNPELTGQDVSYSCHPGGFHLFLSPTTILNGISQTKYSVRISDEKTAIVYFHS